MGERVLAGKEEFWQGRESFGRGGRVLTEEKEFWPKKTKIAGEEVSWQGRESFGRQRRVLVGEEEFWKRRNSFGKEQRVNYKNAKRNCNKMQRGGKTFEKEFFGHEI